MKQVPVDSTRRVLLTGATGFVGRHCLPALVSAGFEVHAVSSHPPPQFAAATPGVIWHEADLLAPGTAFEIIDAVRPTHLLHMAWYAEHGKFWTSTENFRWVQASLDLFRAFAEAGGQRVVAAGSCAEYEWGGGGSSGGDGDGALCVEGRTPLVPASLYGASKHALHLMLEAYAAQAGLSVAWGRIFFLYGPHEHPHRLVASVIRSLLRGEEARCTHGRQVRDFLHAADVAGAFVALLASDARGAINIASGEPVALREVVNKIGEILGREDLICLGALAAPAGDPPFIVADARRLAVEVGWQPKRELSAGLEETITWWRDNVV